MITKAVIYLLVQHQLCYGINWLEHLTNYIQKDAKVNQVIILKGKNEINEVAKVNDALIEITSRIPSRIINFHSEGDYQFSKLNIGDPQEALFIVIADDREFSSLKKPLGLVSNLKPNRSRPKILIIFTEQTISKSFDNLLRQMWFYDFLDATVVSIYTRKGNILSEESQRIRLYHYNPHTNRTWSKKFSLSVKWFPDKTRNLHNYKLTVSINDYQPEVFITIDQTGGRKFSGFGWTKFKALSGIMNFRLITKYQKNWGFLNCENIHNITGALFNLISKKYHFHATEFHIFSNCNDKLFEWSIGLTKSDLCLVVPVLTKESYILNDYWKLLNLFGIIILPLVIWMCLRIVRIETRDLKITYLIQIILGSPTPREPQMLLGKIIFLLMIITCTLYSSMIYSAFTDIGLQKKTIHSLETIDDVLSSDLDTEINYNYVRLLRNLNSRKVLNLINEAKQVNRKPAKCLQQLATKRNIVCVAFSSHAEFLLRDVNNKCLIPKVKLLENDYLSSSLTQTVLAPRSPYVKRINTVLQKLMQSGITEKWKSLYLKRLSKNAVTSIHCWNKSKESQQILWQIFVILLVGYSFSILIFFAEMFVFCKLKFQANHFQIAKHIHGK